MSDYGDLCRDIREARREARMKHGVPCPVCVQKLPRAHPSILLPEQRCRIHGYRDPRKRTAETEYMPSFKRSTEDVSDIAPTLMSERAPDA